VNVQSQVELVWAISSWFSKKDAVVPRALIYPPGQSEKQVEQQNAQEWHDSQESAVTVALTKLGYPVQTYVTNPYGATWLNPTVILQARFVDVGVQVDF